MLYKIEMNSCFKNIEFECLAQLTDICDDIYIQASKLAQLRPSNVISPLSAITVNYNKLLIVSPNEKSKVTALSLLQTVFHCPR